MLFVAVSRATKWVYMISIQGADFPLLDRLRSPKREWLAIQEANARPEPASITRADDLLDKQIPGLPLWQPLLL